jgi:hypothetical protein
MQCLAGKCSTNRIPLNQQMTMIYIVGCSSGKPEWRGNQASSRFTVSQQMPCSQGMAAIAVPSTISTTDLPGLAGNFNRLFSNAQLR